MAKSGIFQRFFDHNSDIHQYSAKQIFVYSSVLKGTSFDVQQCIFEKNDYLTFKCDRVKQKVLVAKTL